MKKNNRKKLMLSIIIAISICLSIITSSSYSQKLNLDTGDWLKYQVLASSGTENMFFGNWPPGEYFGNWSVVPEDQIMYNITSTDLDTINGTLFLGNELSNSTFNDVRNIDVAFGLGFSIYPWNGGFFANISNWSTISVQIQGTNTTINHLRNYEQTINEISNLYKVESFNTQDYYGQFSSFQYHLDTGILLKAFASYGSYELNITLVSTNLELNSIPQTTETSVEFMFTSIVLFSVIFVISKKRLRRK